MDHLAILVRLADLEVERERRALAGLDAQIGSLGQRIALAQAEARRERRAALDLAGARLLADYLEAHRRRLRAAETELAGLERARAQQVARLTKQRLERKRLELLQARHEQRRRAETLRREQQEIDEIALRGVARRRPAWGRLPDQNSGASVTLSPSSASLNGIWHDSREFSWT